MTTTQRASWRIFTITVVLLALFAGYVLGVLTTDAVSHNISFQNGYNAALTDQGGRP